MAFLDTIYISNIHLCAFQGFTHIISKNNQKALDRICEVLDEKVIRQQAEQGVLDFNSYSSFIIQLMAKSCAPIRDDEVNKLNEIDDVVLTFRRILEVMVCLLLADEQLLLFSRLKIASDVIVRLDN